MQQQEQFQRQRNQQNANQLKERRIFKPSNPTSFKKGHMMFQDIKRDQAKEFYRFEHLDFMSMLNKIASIKYWGKFGGPHSSEDQKLLEAYLDRLQKIKQLQKLKNDSILSPYYSLLKWIRNPNRKRMKFEQTPNIQARRGLRYEQDQWEYGEQINQKEKDNIYLFRDQIKPFRQ